MDAGRAATREEIRLRAEEAGLGRVAEAVADLARLGLRLVAKDASRRAPDPAGEGFGEYPPLPEILKASGEARASTRLGGVPLVGEGFSWPRRRAHTRGRYGDEIRAGRPLTFVAQVNLAEVPPSEPSDGMLDFPRRGMLLFFCDEESLPYGSPEDSDGFCVAYLPLDPDDETQTHLADVPEGLVGFDDRGDQWGVPGVVALEALPELALPAPYPDEVRAMGLSDAETDAYWHLTEELEREGARVAAWVAEAPGTARYPPIHRLGGVPHEIQNPMETECELARRGEDPLVLPYSRKEEIADEAKARWRLLLQVDSDDEAGMMWGDAGMLYYWIRDDDLAARRFDRAWCVMQCY
jgi:uncharacterized protein YwqG